MPAEPITQNMLTSGRASTIGFSRAYRRNTAMTALSCGRAARVSVGMFPYHATVTRTDCPYRGQFCHELLLVDKATGRRRQHLGRARKSWLELGRLPEV